MAKRKPSIDFNNPVFVNKDKARKYLEQVRWPDGPVCPHCGCYERVMELQGKSTRPGVYKCGDCRKQFTVTVGTVFERSHIPLNKWVLATHLICSSKKGMSVHQLHRMMGVTYKTAWFMAHRIREAMREPFTGNKMGGGGMFVEVDETYVGQSRPRPGKAARAFDKEKVITLVERDGRARSFHVNAVNSKTVRKILHEQIASDSAIMTDEAPFYKKPVAEFFAGHATVSHSTYEYVRGAIHTNTIEGFFSIFKRGLTGVYQHCSRQHLKRYLAEFDFRYSYRSKLGYEDHDRTVQALKGIEGKRLVYLPISRKQGLLVEAGL
jgi:transposase-like protein